LLTSLTEKLNKQKIANPLNSNNTIPQTETKPEGEKEKPIDNAVEPDSSKGNTNSNNPKPTTSPPSTPLEDKVQQDIQQAQKEVKNSLRNDISKAKHGTDEDKFNAIKNSGKVLGEQGFEEEKTELAVIEEELAVNNPSRYLEAILAKIEENLKKNKLTIEELDSETRADYQNIKEDEETKEDKINKINERICKNGAQKRIEKLKEKVSKIAKLSKQKVQKLKARLLKIINSKNKYEQEYQNEAQNLLVQLEQVSKTQKPNSNDKFPIGLVVGGIVLLIGGIITLFIIRNRRNKKLIR
jgi:hypothetical protein